MAEKLVRYLTFRLSDEAVLAKETPLDFKGLIAEEYRDLLDLPDTETGEGLST